MAGSSKSDIKASSNPLLTAYSVKEIMDILLVIDQKIASLHSCSSDDFLTLNNHFKTYFRDSKIISGNASRIFDVISGSSSQDFLTDLRSFFERFNALSGMFENYIQQVYKTFERVNNNLNMLFLPVNDYRQNISTLKYLAANLKLDASYSDKEKKGKAQKDPEELVHIIESLKKQLQGFDILINRTKKGIADILTKLESQKYSTLRQISGLSEQLQNSIELLSVKHKEVVGKIPVLRQKTENTSAGIAKIITNLQYHDIIRQKIEHIQQTQQELLKELQALDSATEDRTTIHDQAKVFMKIRDIAGLQAAQLLHANKEYQLAIETITGKFIEIGDNMSMISDLCQELFQHQEGSDRTHFEEVQKTLGEAHSLAQNYSSTNHHFETKLASTMQEFETLVSEFQLIEKLDREMNELADEAIKISLSENAAGSKTQQQIRNLLSDIRASLNQITPLINTSLDDMKDMLVQSANLNTETELDNNLNKFRNSLPDILGILSKNNVVILDILGQNKNTSEGIIASVKIAVQNVRYYDFFEKIIDEIISELNTINIRLNSGSADGQSRVDNLEFLKKKYTMESEHKIHEAIAGSADGSALDILQANEVKPEKENKEEDDNLELF